MMRRKMDEIKLYALIALGLSSMYIYALTLMQN
jgi:hypothetical protein